jgi:hypothetical protein
MAENSTQQYLVRDPQGNVYGPADEGLLRAWAAQGRIVPGMHVAAKETGEWLEVSGHPALAGCFSELQASEPAELVPPEEVKPEASAGPVVEPWPQEVSGGTLMPTASPVAAAPVSAGSAQTGPAQAGWPVAYASDGPRQNVPAVLSMIAGIVAMVGSPIGFVPVCGCMGMPFVGVMALVASVLGMLGISQIRGNPQRLTGEGKAIAGIVLGIVSILLAGAGMMSWIMRMK